MAAPQAKASVFGRAAAEAQGKAAPLSRSPALKLPLARATATGETTACREHMPSWVCGH